MRVLDALHEPWAIQPEMLKTMFEIYERHARGEKPDFEAIKAQIGKNVENDAGDYYVEDGVAVISVMGVLAKRMDLFTQISGGASTQRLQQELQAALGDPGVHSIVLAIDSPGGAVDGVQALADDIYAGRQQKPIYALIDGVGASGAYWLASAADQVYITGDTTMVGSIGVVMAHRDVSKAEAMRGVKTTEIVAGKYKRIDSNYAPLTDEGRQYIQGIVDHIDGIFVSAVARNRGTSVDAVRRDMADGRIFLGKQAIDAGLVDSMTTMDALIGRLANDWATGAIGAFTPTAKAKETAMETKINAEQLESAKAEAFANGKAEGATVAKETLAAEHQRGKVEGISEGASAERERIKSVEAQALPGHEKLIAELKFDGKTTGAEAAVAVLKAEREKKAQVGADLKDDAPKPVTSSEAPITETKPEPKPEEIAASAKKMVAEQKKLGITITLTEAVHKVRAELGLK